MVASASAVTMHKSVVFLTMLSAATATWSYAGKTGPEHWGGTCASGESQSPIDLTNPVYEQLDELNFTNYDTQVITARNLGP